ncbi:helix-turn-helix domain-containing protein [Bacillus sp. JCM 19041]|uniref:helix-turn-helix domain-containing protein n=1 Tax=Bacillus sp. JCM 19041 TaxID=1460637 RepID=UPI0006D1F071
MKQSQKNYSIAFICRTIWFIFFIETLSEGKTANDYVDQHFISRATFFRKLKKLNDWLQTYNLTFDLRTSQISGDEREIRQFYYFTLLEITGKITWPFPVEKRLIEARLDRIINALALQLSNSQKEAYLYLLAVQWYRNRQGHYSPEYDRFFPKELREQIALSCGIFLDLLPETARKGEEDFLLMIVLNSPCVYHPLPILEANMEVNQKNDTEAWAVTTCFSETLETLFPNTLTEQNKKHVRGHLLQLYRNHKYHSSSFLSYKDLIYAKAIKKQHPLLSNVISRVTDEMANSGFLTDHALQIRYLLLLYTFVDVNKLHPPVRLLILSSEGPIYEDALSEKIHDYVPFHLDISTSAIAEVEPEPYSIILTDTPIAKETNDNILYIHYPPTFLDWRRIYEHCEKLYWNRLNYLSLG